MLEIIRSFEHLAEQFHPAALIAAGLVALLAGIFVWLGGFGLRKALFVVAGAACGTIGGFFISGWNPLLAVAIIGASAFLTAMFEEKFLAAIGAGIIAVVGFMTLIRPYITPTGELFNTIRQGVVIVPWQNWAILAGLVLLPIVVAVLYWRFTAALLCAAVGTLLLFIGAGLLLLFNGISAAGYISRTESFYGWVFLAMAAVGTLEQLFLSKTVSFEKGAKLAKKALGKKAKKDEVPEKTASWRSA